MNKPPSASAKTPPVALTIAGSDSSAGAGVQSDLKTFAAHGVYGVCAVTALVAEVPGAVRGIESVSSSLLTQQLESIASGFPVSVVKTGMLSTAEAVDAVVRFLKEQPPLPLVVDPVLRAGSGTLLLSSEGLDRLKSDLFPLARLVTPNLPEAEILLGETIRTDDEFRSSAFRLHQRYGGDFLVKGGHFSDGDRANVTDCAWISGEVRLFTRPRLPVPDLHGTGCTLSAAIAAQIALGRDCATAVSEATSYLAACMEQYFRWPAGGASIEALNHFPDRVESP